MQCLARLAFLSLLLVKTDGAGGFFWGGGSSSRGSSGSEGDRKERSFDRKPETGSMSSRTGRNQASKSYFSEVIELEKLAFHLQLRRNALSHEDSSSSIYIKMSHRNAIIRSLTPSVAWDRIHKE
jgi:hypothetical protein